MISPVVFILLCLGGFFCLLAAVGVCRFDDFYMRIHAATKASAFGLGFSIMGAAAHLGTVSAWAKAIVAILFLFFTLPVSAHLLARAQQGDDTGSPNGQDTGES
ncbi:MAG: monovalent cation/H(+) antiporter subunit G [Verrucomicrobiales bacterium]